MKTFTLIPLPALNKVKQIVLYTLKIGLLSILLGWCNQSFAQSSLPIAYTPGINSNENTRNEVSVFFSRGISKATVNPGNIVITTTPGGVFESIPVSSAAVTIIENNSTNPITYGLVIKFEQALPEGALVDVNIPASALVINSLAPFAGISTWKFNTSLSGPILFGSSPDIGATVGTPPTSIRLDFHEDIFKGSGSIIVTGWQNALPETINVASSAVTISAGSPRSATINLATARPLGTAVYVEVPAGAFKDAGNLGSSRIYYSFRVADVISPTLQSTTPAHQSTISPTDRVITFTFSEPIFKGTGLIYFRNKANGSIAYSPSINGGEVTVTGNTLTVTKPSNWVGGVDYYVSIPGTGIQDASGNYYAGITSTENSAYNFTTCTQVNPGISIALTAGTSPACQSQSFTFTATPTNGGTSPSYQWKVGTVNVGTNSPTFTTSTLSGGLNAVSCVLTSNAACVSTPTATSGYIFVSIQNPITPSVSITSAPANATICAGNSVTFNASAVNAGASPSYQWKVNGVNVGTNQNSFTTASLTNGQIVTCMMTRDDNGCVTSTTATSNPLTMTVGALPVQPTVITGNATVCQGGSSAYSVTNVAGTFYTWDTGNAGTVTGTGNSVNITWNSSGAKTLTVSASNSCGTATARTLAVTVSAAPAQPSIIVGSATAGQNQSNQYSVTNETGTTYTWNAGSGGTVTGSGNAVSILWTTAGGKTITVTPSTSCGSGTARTLGVTVGASCTAPAQPSTISGSATACTGSSGTYSITPVGGVNYNWNAGVDGNVSGMGDAVTLSWTSIGTKTVTVTPFTDCGSGTARTLTVNVSALPAQPSTIAGNTTACFNSSNTYSVTNVSGVTYTWDAAGKGTITGTGNSVSVQWTAAGTNTLTVTPSNGCGNGLTRTLSVTVNTVALGTSVITGANLTCTGISGSYSVVNVGGVTYAWNAGAGGTVTGSGNSVSISWSSGGDKVVQVTPSNSCGSGSPTTLTVSVTATVAQPGAMSGATSVDAGTTNTYSVTNVPGVNYTWSTSADGVIVPNGNSAQVSWTTGGSKTLTVTPSNVCGNGTVRSITVNVATPCVIPSTSSVIITSGAANTQAGQTLRMQVTFSTGATSYDLSVSPSTGITLTPVSANTWDVTFASAGEYTVSGKGVSACGTSGPATLGINVCALTINPPASLTGPIDNICPSSTTRYQVDSPIVGYSYDWNFGGAPGLTVSYLNAQRSIADITWNTTWTGVGITVKSRNACNTVSSLGTSISVSLVAKPAYASISSFITGGVCIGTGSYVYTINLPETGVDYNWILNGAGTVAGNKLSATIPIDGQSRIIKVLGSNSCFVNEEVGSIGFGGGTPTPMQPSPVAGPAIIDVNVDGTFTVEAQPAGISYNWGAGADATITNTATPNSKLIRWSTGGTKTINLNASSGCGISAIRSYSLYVNGPCEAPAIPNPITGGTSGCANVEHIFSVPFQPNTTFNWSAGADATITGTGTTRNIKWSTAGAKTITVSATNGCSTSASQTKPFTVLATPAQPAGLTGGSLACSGSTEVFAVNPVTGGVTYAWEIQGGTFTTSGAQNEIVSITWSSAGSSIIKVKASNTCGFGPERTIARDISTTPLQPSIINGEAEVCTGTSKPYSVTNVAGTTYTWNGGTGATVTGSGNAVSISWSAAGAKTISVTPSTSCGNGTARTFSVNVGGVPAQPATIVGNASPVLGNAVAYSVTNVAGVNYAWSLSDKGVLTNSGNTSSVSWNNIGSAILSVSASNLCGASAARTQAITVNKIPQTIAFTLTSPILANAEITLTGISDSGLPITYASSNTTVAEIQGNSLVIKSSGTITITASQAGDATYAAASNVVRSLTINKASQSIIFSTLSAKVFNDAAFNVEATVNSLLPLSFTSSNTSVATVDSDGTITILSVGSTNITASQGGDAKYNSATSVVRALTVNKADQAIEFEPLVAKGISDPPFLLTGTSSSGLTLTYSSSNTSVATVSGTTVTLLGVGTTTISALQSGNANYNAATAVSQELVVSSKTDQTITFNSLSSKTLGDAPFNLSATASSGLAVSYSTTSSKITLAGSQVTLVSAGRASITASQIGNATFNAASDVNQSFCINPAKPAVTQGPGGEMLTLTSSSAAGNQWFKDGATISGATNINFDVTAPGVYKVQVTVDDCVSQFSNDVAMVVTGDQSSQQVEWKLFPNPAEDKLYIALPGTGTKHVQVIQGDGRVMDKVSTELNEVVVLVNQYAQGIYFVRVQNDKGTFSGRFVKK